MTTKKVSHDSHTRVWDRPDLGENDCNLPPLPIIQSDKIHLEVFTHRSFFGRPTHIFEDPLDDLSPDNEKYALDRS